MSDKHLQRSLETMAILKSWGLTAEEQIKVLDLPTDTRTRAMRRYQENTPLPETDNVLARMEHILGIAEALRTSYPFSPAAGTLWMQQAQKRFNNRIPIRMIVEDGCEGLVNVRYHVDCAYSWHLTDPTISSSSA